jgi:hypothetical protein
MKSEDAPQGSNGPQGPDGIKGKDGLTPEKAERLRREEEEKPEKVLLT